MENVEMILIAEHQVLGVGEIEEISFDNGNPIIHVDWRSGIKSDHGENELEFYLEFAEQTR